MVLGRCCWSVVLGERGVFEGFLGMLWWCVGRCFGSVVEVLEGGIEYFWVGVC